MQYFKVYNTKGELFIIWNFWSFLWLFSPFAHFIVAFSVPTFTYLWAMSHFIASSYLDHISLSLTTVYGIYFQSFLF